MPKHISKWELLFKVWAKRVINKEILILGGSHGVQDLWAACIRRAPRQGITSFVVEVQTHFCILVDSYETRSRVFPRRTFQAQLPCDMYVPEMDHLSFVAWLDLNTDRQMFCSLHANVVVLHTRTPVVLHTRNRKVSRVNATLIRRVSHHRPWWTFRINAAVVRQRRRNANGSGERTSFFSWPKTSNFLLCSPQTVQHP